MMAMGALCFIEQSLAHLSPEKSEEEISHTNKKYYFYLSIKTPIALTT